MKHKFRKYISNRGSALFMVLSVMTSLIVTTMAMYFSVVSSRKTQYAIFNQQQSYQSALSLSESLLGGIIAGTDDANKTGFNALAQAVSNMSVGETITTSGNGFSSFDAAGGTKIDEDQVGAYIADITFLSETDEGRLFDFAVTTMVNGTESTVHQYVLIPKTGVTPPTGGGGVPERLFTSSGLVPSNSAIGGGAMFCDVFYDTEYAFMAPYGSEAAAQNQSEARLQNMGNIYAAGSLEMNYGIEKTVEEHNWAGKRPIEWIIRKDFILSNEGNNRRTAFPSDGVLSGTTYADKTNRIIVGGDFIVKADAQGLTNVDIYVLGDLYLDGTDYTNKFGSSVRIFYCGNMYDGGGYLHFGVSGVKVYQTESSWLSAPQLDSRKVLTVDECISRIRTCTSSITYYDWNTAYESIPGIDHVENLNLEWNNPKYLVWSEDSQGCTINSISASGGSGGGDGMDGYKIIIDTGNDPDNTYTIKLNGYLDGGKTFSWFPRKEDTNMFVLVKGRGSVVFEVQKGVKYANWSNRTIVMHYDWIYGLGMNSQSSRDNVADLKSYVHWDCGEDCTTCKNEGVQLSVVGEENKKNNTCGVCGNAKYFFECTRHGFRKSLCPDCEGTYYKFVKEGGKIYSIGTCGNRIDYGSTGSCHPTLNIYLVVCSPQSDIEFTWPDTKTYSNFWGYIYAPYVTLSFNGKVSSGETLTFVGGIAVADFKMSGFNTYVGIYPDKLPSELMSSKCLEHKLPGIDNKPWKQGI